MERVWTFDRLAVTMRRVDFLDPALAGRPDARERGVRVEIKPAHTQAEGSVYAADVVTLDQAWCRCDFLESGPGRADRMHWHPEMADGRAGQADVRGPACDGQTGFADESVVGQLADPDAHPAALLALSSALPPVDGGSDTSS